MKNKIYLQITSGRGPAECCRAVALVLEKILHQAKSKGLITEVLYREQVPIAFIISVRTGLWASVLMNCQQ